MSWGRRSIAKLVLAGAVAGFLTGTMDAAPASAQFFLRNPDLSGPPMIGNEPDIGFQLPNATPTELRAGMVWATRAALNVAALQCQFEPTLMTVDNYNAILTDHKAELAGALDTLNKYFIRVNGKNRARGVSALDRFGTRLYSGFSTVNAQFVFCLTTASIAREAVFARRGTFGEIAVSRMRELRNSLRPAGEQQFPQRGPIQGLELPKLTDPNCWTKRKKWDVERCGVQRG
ncbi:MAG: hypothetical protein WC816_09340 [Sphingomonas sp.]|jgi:hypothetical protein